MSNLNDILIFVEDKKFYSHHGIDFRAILRAAWVNIKEWRYAQGGSTITQQLARMLYLSNKKTIMRKMVEMFIAFYLESKYTKDQILSLYSANCYLGQGVRGFQQGAEHYFNVPLELLTLKEKSTLVAMLKGPNYYTFNSERLKTRVEKILSQYEQI